MFLVIKKKYLIYILFVLFLFLFQLGKRYSDLPVFIRLRNPLQKKVIVIDPGHGGIDGGTNRKGLLEKNINLAISLKLREVLEDNNAEVIMTRDKDTALDHLNSRSRSRHVRDLWARVEIINQEKVDLFISIHVNAGSSYLRGPLVFYQDDNKDLAHLFQVKLNEMEFKGLEPVDNAPIEGDYFLLRNAQKPGLLIEVGYITNPMDNRLLQKDDYQWLVARTLYYGIEEYFSSFAFYLDRLEQGSTIKTNGSFK
ncbi:MULTISPECIES: N-acetylmuramoyl-L-alanine amidase family protein [unclassified Candidatus Frackibacter]|uniref:N-acetylmuramoyl-L-alanine amidase family protein n=1 Tax=unclassified Candidatus Frackibacter TaxID=2648818 RepID=UPI00088DC952|nr:MULTISPECIES: N-acetylmuramoyl-L-alanine amidase [unclassified Candidatus Frackibacter]SDC80206.1 N-acetylmuramoyl-L-alanine amidase [Candidatus Frackibacter sp. WG11]SEM92698.1 N-acetylmuramoyl-L-alanine amidase [Candidatus Frackibacter sp. WG12]SFM03208.1 N-acetylmuramoyl-L-alanine amidase [Candidatus Frackibacter sp. WG13]